MIKKIAEREAQELLELSTVAYFCDLGFCPGEDYKYPEDKIVVAGKNGWFVINESDIIREGCLVKLSEEAERITGGLDPFYTDEEMGAFKV